MADKFMVRALAIVAVLLVTVVSEDSSDLAANTGDSQSQSSPASAAPLDFLTTFPSEPADMSKDNDTEAPDTTTATSTTTTSTTTKATTVAVKERDVTTSSNDCSSQLKIFFASHSVPERAIAKGNLTQENYCKELNDSLSHFKDACSQNTVEPDDSHIFASLSNGTEFLCGNESRNMADFFVNGTVCSNSISTHFKNCSQGIGNYTFPVEMILTGTRTDCENLTSVIRCVDEALADSTSCSDKQKYLMGQIMNTVLPKNCSSTPSTTVDPGSSTKLGTAVPSEGIDNEPTEPSEEPTEPSEEPSESTTAEPENPASGSKSLELNLFVMLCVLVVTYWMH